MAYGEVNEEKTKIVEESIIKVPSRTTVVSDKEANTEKVKDTRNGTEVEKVKLERTRPPVKRLVKTQAASAAASRMKQPMKIVVEKKSKRVKNGKKQPADPADSGASHFDLVVDAIALFKDRNGSSRQAIAKFVAGKKPNYANHLLRKALQTGVEKGKFIEIKKGFYKLSPEQKKKAMSSSKVKVSEKNKKEQKMKPKMVPKKTVAKKMAPKKKMVVKKAPTKKLVRSKAKGVQKTKKVSKHKSAKPAKRTSKKSTAEK
uniref:Histone H1 putative n=1 Tax=Albugo laibachii Nc14 TaxID=890382 RepID=F0WKI7_9STRA|nr:histone H1 putative [Albugo laibachii Nc14]|eukprot:CCA21793.1 histone H1 putative [Albugo laibachii Nc14]